MCTVRRACIPCAVNDTIATASLTPLQEPILHHGRSGDVGFLLLATSCLHSVTGGLSPADPSEVSAIC